MPLNDVPLSGQTLASSRSLIQGNFSTIGTAFTVDHINYGLSDQGKHNQVTFPINASPTAPAATELRLYNINYATTGLSELFVRRDAGSAIPFTAQALSAGQGWTFLPSGLLIKYGVLTGLSAGSHSQAYAGPGFSANPYSVQLTASNGGTASTNGPQGSGSVAFVTTGSGITVYYLAIGPS